jgi:hypothetical protein
MRLAKFGCDFARLSQKGRNQLKQLNASPTQIGVCIAACAELNQQAKVGCRSPESPNPKEARNKSQIRKTATPKSMATELQQTAHQHNTPRVQQPLPTPVTHIAPHINHIMGVLNVLDECIYTLVLTRVSIPFLLGLCTASHLTHHTHMLPNLHPISSNRASRHMQMGDDTPCTPQTPYISGAGLTGAPCNCRVGGEREDCWPVPCKRGTRGLLACALQTATRNHARHASSIAVQQCQSVQDAKHPMTETAGQLLDSAESSVGPVWHTGCLNQGAPFPFAVPLPTSANSPAYPCLTYQMWQQQLNQPRKQQDQARE